MSEGLSVNCSLIQAKDWLRSRVNDGATCPCCTQFAKVYRRKINSSMACGLILISKFFRKNSTDQWLHVPSYLGELDLPPNIRVVVRGGDWAKLVFWKCLEPRPGEREDGSTRTGYWRITPVGTDFANNATILPKYARIYDDRCLGLEGDPVSIHEAIKDRFNYGELMEGV